jgi:RNA polymerase sigma-70 factor (ECF subfamily)
MAPTFERPTMEENDLHSRFEATVLPHLDAAYNLARWLTGNEHDAEDVTQDACVRAFRFFGGFQGGNCRSWLLTIVRNTAYTWLDKNRGHRATDEFDEEVHVVEDHSTNPEAVLLKQADRENVRQAVEQLPAEFREVIVLRELEELSYREIAGIAGVPIGTVMSRLSRARKLLQQTLSATAGGPK